MAEPYEHDTSQDKEKYGKITIETFAPAPYYAYGTKTDEYSHKIVQSKKQDLSDFFYDKVKNVFVLAAGPEAGLICVVPNSTIGGFSPTMQRIGERLSVEFKIPFENVLCRTKVPSKKMTLCKDANERYESVRGTIGLSRKLTDKEKKIVILDDVKAEGYTKLECAKILIEGGAEKVRSICLGINRGIW